MNAQQAFDQIIGLITKWAQAIAGTALVIVAAAMLVKPLSVLVQWPINLATPPLDQNTGIALAALAYVLGRR